MITAILEEMGSTTLFFGRVMKTAFHTQGNLQPILKQIIGVTLRSLSTVIFAGLFVGAILALQFNQMLVQYDAQIFLGGLNTSAVVREVGPLIISFLLAGKIGAFTAAELGTMRVTEQIEAIECLGTNSIQYLIVPRLLAIMISSLLLLIIGLMVSVGGALLVAVLYAGMNPVQYLSSIPRFTGVWTISCGLLKSVIYGTIVATVACQKGFNASGGARGVGRAVTTAAVYTNLYIVLANFMTSQILDSIHQFGEFIARVLS
ncbi:MAG: ABC transporter permease [Methylotenera sp.]|nr:ABC transporter permease [Oligoflexia bacterium]